MSKSNGNPRDQAAASGDERGASVTQDDFEATVFDAWTTLQRESEVLLQLKKCLSALDELDGQFVPASHLARAIDALSQNVRGMDDSSLTEKLKLSGFSGPREYGGKRVNKEEVSFGSSID